MENKYKLNPRIAQTLSKYFTIDDWNDMSLYEKFRYQNIYNNYIKSIQSGKFVGRPDFMRNRREIKHADLNNTYEKHGVERKKRHNGISSRKDNSDIIAKIARKISMYFPENVWETLSENARNLHCEEYRKYVDTAIRGTYTEAPNFLKDYNERMKPKIEIIEISDDSIKEDDNKESKRCLQNFQKSCTETSENCELLKRNVVLEKETRKTSTINDEYIFCDRCKLSYLHGCKDHILIRIRDGILPKLTRNKERSRYTIPEKWLKIRTSSAFPNSEGVWTIRNIPLGVRFGPYEGVISEHKTSSRYCWKIVKENEKILYLSGEDKKYANWMRYVNHARNHEEQNLTAYQFYGKIYYRTIVEIPADTELLVKLQKIENLPVCTQVSTDSGINSREESFICNFCKAQYSNEKLYKQHLQEHPQKPVYTCHKCQKQFHLFSTFTIHNCNYQNIIKETMSNVESRPIEASKNIDEIPKMREKEESHKIEMKNVEKLNKNIKLEAMKKNGKRTICGNGCKCTFCRIARIYKKLNDD